LKTFKNSTANMDFYKRCRYKNFLFNDKMVPHYSKWLKGIMTPTGEIPKDIRLRVKADSISLEKWDKDVCNTRLKFTNFVCNNLETRDVTS
jgi:hypothetical protein